MQFSRRLLLLVPLAAIALTAQARVALEHDLSSPSKTPECAVCLPDSCPTTATTAQNTSADPCCAVQGSGATTYKLVLDSASQPDASLQHVNYKYSGPFNSPSPSSSSNTTETIKPSTITAGFFSLHRDFAPYVEVDNQLDSDIILSVRYESTYIKMMEQQTAKQLIKYKVAKGSKCHHNMPTGVPPQGVREVVASS